MITCFDNIKPIFINNMRGGEGTVIMKKIELADKSVKTYALLTVPVGASIGLHTHIDDEEVIFCLAGKGSIIDGDIKVPFNTGDVNYTKTGCSHSIINDSEYELKLIAVIYKI